jgi:hypothetical protein
VLLAKEASTVLRAIDLGGEDSIEDAKIYLKDIITTASDFGTRGTLQRLAVRHPKIGSVLKFSNQASVLTLEM